LQYFDSCSLNLTQILPSSIEGLFVGIIVLAEREQTKDGVLRKPGARPDHVLKVAFALHASCIRTKQCLLVQELSD
jgi:hypothetical protein